MDGSQFVRIQEGVSQFMIEPVNERVFIHQPVPHRAENLSQHMSHVIDLVIVSFTDGITVAVDS